MSGPIVRTGASPKFWENWSKAFGDGSSDKKPAKKKSEKPATEKPAAEKKAAKPAKKPARGKKK